MGGRMRALIGTMERAAIAGAALAGAVRGEQPAAAPAEQPTAAPAEAPPGSCESFTRSSVGTPPLVHDWLVRSADDHVRVCARQSTRSEAPGEPLYSGESAPIRHGAVCSYSHHDLSRLGHGAASPLQR